MIARLAARGRIALFMDSLYGSGAERAMLHLAEGFARRGHPVDFVVCRVEGQFVHDVPEGVRLVALEPRRSPSAQLRAHARHVWRDPSVIAPLLRFPKGRYLAPLADYLRRERPQALLAANTIPNLLAVWARELAGVDTRVVLSEQIHFSAQVAQVSKRWKLPLESCFYPRAEAIVAVSQGVADDLVHTAGIPRERVETVHNPVLGPRLLELSREAVDHPWLQEGAPPVVLAVGKLKPRKDFPTLLRAFQRVREQREARLLILGHGEEEASLKALAGELGIGAEVDLPGFAANPFAYMARSALLVLTSLWEGLPTVLIEALACGCPIVSTDCPSGPAEILEGGRYGQLVPVGDHKVLAEAILSVLDEPPPRELLRARAEVFGIERSVERYLELLRG